jgi:nucleoside-diphosphate-sugar epimerase
MKLVVVGATGATGRKVVERALAKGHKVLAVSRRPLSDLSPSEHLSFRVADVRDATSLVSVFAGSDVVISTIGPERNLSPGDLMSVGTINILAACREAKVGHFVMQSGITLTDGSDLSMWDRFALRPIRFIYRKALVDKLLAEAATQSSDIDWVIVRPTGLKDAPPTGTYIAGPRARIALLRPLSFSDCADCLVRAASDESQWNRKIVNVGM